MSSIILFISDRLPTTEQINAAEAIGYSIVCIGKINPFVSQEQLHNFIHFKRNQQMDKIGGEFGEKQRDIVIHTEIPSLALMSNNDGHTVVLFDEDNSIHFFDPQFSAPFVHIPYTPPPIPERQEITVEEREELKVKQLSTVGVGSDE